MITMTNVLKHGLTTWDRATLPEDEFEERVRALRAAMAAEGLEAVVSLGHATRPGPFAYFSGFVPPLGWMGVVIGREADPILVSGGGSRERIFVRTVTPIEDLRNSRSLFHGPAEIVSEALAEVAEAGDRIGLVGADDALTDATRRELAEALSVYAVSDANQLLTTIRTVKRPREVTALRRSLAIARRAVDDAIKRFEEGESAAAALLAAEATGRRSGGRDVRVLGDLGDGQLAPVEELSPGRPERFVVYCAVEHLGYWGQATGASAASPVATAALEAMVAQVGSSVETARLADAAIEHLPGGAADIALSYGLGGGIGLDLEEHPEIDRNGTVIADGAVLALQVITREDGGLGAASATVRVRAGGVDRL